MNTDLKTALFAAESVAHLRGFEREILPLADLARSQAARIAELENALGLADATLERVAPGGSRATQGTRDVTALVLKPKRRYFNWKPVVGSLLATLQQDGYELLGYNGTPRQRRQAAKRAICGVDEAHVRVKKGERVFTLFLVLGNEPEELVADYTAENNLEKSIDKFIVKWQGRSCPQYFA